jgi:hypothetical protein
MLELHQVPVYAFSRLVCLCCVAVWFYWKCVLPSKEYASMHFVHSTCNGSGWVSVVEYWQRHPIYRISHRETFDYVHRTLREIASFPSANATSEQRQRVKDDARVAVHRSLSTSIRIISRTTGVAPWLLLFVPPPKSTTPLATKLHQPCTILWMAATTAIYSAWHSVHGCGSI